MKTPQYILIILITIITFGCKSPKELNDNKVSIVYTTAKNYHNLFGSVKEVRCYFTKNFKPVDTNKKPIMSTAFMRDPAVTYNAGNGMGNWNGYSFYDRNGMRTISYPLKDSIMQVVPDSVYTKYIYI